MGRAHVKIGPVADVEYSAKDPIGQGMGNTTLPMVSLGGRLVTFPMILPFLLGWNISADQAEVAATLVGGSVLAAVRAPTSLISSPTRALEAPRMATLTPIGKPREYLDQPERDQQEADYW